MISKLDLDLVTKYFIACYENCEDDLVVEADSMQQLGKKMNIPATTDSKLCKDMDIPRFDS